MGFTEEGQATSEEFRRRFAEMFGGASEREKMLGQDLRDVRAQLEAELEQAGQKQEGVEEVDLSITRADVLRRVYTERYG